MDMLQTSNPVHQQPTECGRNPHYKWTCFRLRNLLDNLPDWSRNPHYKWTCFRHNYFNIKSINISVVILTINGHASDLMDDIKSQDEITVVILTINGHASDN